MKHKDVFPLFPLHLQLMYFILIAAGCHLVVSNLAVLLSVAFWGKDAWNQTAPLLFIQFFSTIGTFLLPALWLGRMKKKQDPGYLGTRTRPPLTKTAIALAAYLLLIPSISALQDWSGNWNLSESPVSWLRWLHQKSEISQQLTLQMLQVRSWGLFGLTILTVGVCAGICEEFFFRGGLQRLLQEWFKNPHAAIWVTAAVFSIVHLDPYGFLPRLLLGALLGYAGFWSGSLWLPILLHVLNNSAMAALEFLHYNGYIAFSMERLEENPGTGLLAASLVLLCALVMGAKACGSRRRKTRSKESGNATAEN